MKILRLILFLFPFLLFANDLEEFDRLMGKDTSHWIYVKKEEDIHALDLCKKLYGKNKKHLSTEQGPYKIPKVIHWIWLGPNAFPPESVEHVRSWIAQHPDWTFKFWTDDDRPSPCKGMQKMLVRDFPFLFLRERFQQTQNYGEKSDLLRFEILYQEGGLYVDHDANCLKKFDNLHRGFDFYCGLETPHPPFVGRNITVGNGLIGSRPFHPVIGKVIELIHARWELIAKKYRGFDGYSRTQRVIERTYMMLTQAIVESIDQEGHIDIVLPACYFFAKSGLPPLYSKHFFADSWSKEREDSKEFQSHVRRAVNKISQKNKMLWWIGAGAFSLNILAFAGMFFYLMKKKNKL